MEAVKLGWSWPGFLFNGFWALFKKMWVLGIGAIVGVTVLCLILDSIIGNVGGGPAAVIGIVFGMYGNKWREANLKYRGYDVVDTVVGSNPEGAIAMYLDRK